MEHQLLVESDADGVATSAAGLVAALARGAVDERGTFTFAVSGGSTPWAMFARLADEDVPWEQVVIYQVDERVAPEDDPDRNLAHLRDALGSAPARIRPMPVESDDLDAAAAQYAQQLPDSFDLIHLGLGPDGHTASLVPDDAVLDEHTRLVAPTSGEYQGRRRMTLTYPALAHARELLWLVVGESKHTALRQLLTCDQSIPAGRVEAGASTVLADSAAAGRATPDA